MVSDILGDALTRIKNGVDRKKESVEVLRSNVVVAVLKVLKKEEFIKSFTEADRTVTVDLLYVNEEAAATTFSRVSKPGQRVYLAAKDNKPIMNGRGISIISTSEGVMTGSMAKSRGLGGEYLCKVW